MLHRHAKKTMYGLGFLAGTTAIEDPVAGKIGDLVEQGLDRPVHRRARSFHQTLLRGQTDGRSATTVMYVAAPRYRPASKNGTAFTQ